MNKMCWSCRSLNQLTDNLELRYACVFKSLQDMDGRGIGCQNGRCSVRVMWHDLEFPVMIRAANFWMCYSFRYIIRFGFFVHIIEQ